MEPTSRYNYYDILEISSHCPQHEVTTAYERMRATYSGENQAIYTMFSEEEARDLLRLVEEAYSVLGNKTLRALYDEKIGKAGKNMDVSFEALQTESKTVFNELPKKTITARPEYQVNEQFENQIRNSDDWTGSLLKQVREYKNLSLEKMSEITRISAYYINAVEKVDCANLPAPVFVRGYVSQICRILNLDEKRVCENYMRNFKTVVGKK